MWQEEKKEIEKKRGEGCCGCRHRRRCRCCRCCCAATTTPPLALTLRTLHPTSGSWSGLLRHVDVRRRRRGVQVELLLKHGAYDVFKEGKEGEEASKKFCEDDIESILSRAKVKERRTGNRFNACLPAP